MTASQLSETETAVLAHIRAKSDGAFQSELWKDLGVDSRTCSRILKKLEESGYIEREECKTDVTRRYPVRIVKYEKSIDPKLQVAGDSIVS